MINSAGRSIGKNVENVGRRNMTAILTTFGMFCDEQWFSPH
jgi:hypothetical protein